jgi:hypothetical protein
MGNCVRREFGIDEVKETHIDHEQMFKNIVIRRINFRVE